MNTYYFRALDRSTLVSELVSLGFLNDDDEGTRPTQTSIVWDEIGTIYEPTGEVNEDGTPIVTPITNEEGVPYWHANIYSVNALDIPENLVISPSFPDRELWI